MQPRFRVLFAQRFSTATMLKSTCVARITLFSSTWLRSKAWFCLALMSFALVYAQTSPPLPLAGALYISLSCCLLFYSIALLNMPPKCLSNTDLTLALSLLPCYDVSRVLSLPSYARVQKLTFFALTLGYMMATAFTSCLKALKQRSCAPWFGSYYVGSSLGRWFLSMMAC